MSRGPGVVQRAIIAAYDNQPTKLFTVDELCGAAYPGQQVTEAHREAVRRAVRGLKDELGLLAGRGGAGGRHWRYKIGRSAVSILGQ